MNCSLSRALVLVALSSSASAQFARALVREGDALPDAPAGHLVTALTEPAVNHATGFAVGLSTSDGAETLSHFWGAASAGGSPAIVRTEATVNGFEQLSFESFWGFSNSGQVAYSPIGTNLSSGVTGIDAAWLDDLVLAEELQPIPSLPGTVWRFASRPGVSGGGEPYWIGGIDDAATGGNNGRGLFLGPGATPVLVSGDVLPGTGGPINAGGISFDYRFSAANTHYIVEIDTTEATALNSYMILDGQVLTAGGPTNQVREGSPVPLAAGGLPGENWDNFDSTGVTEDGDWFFSGDTDGDTATDEIVVKNGVILMREGDTVDGAVLTGAIDEAYMNEAGNIALIWNVLAPAGDVEALFINDELFVKEGDAVDLDGDGVVEPGSVLVNLTDVRIASDNLVYFVATVDVAGTSTTSDDVEALFVAECMPVPYGIGKLNSAGTRADMSFAGTPSLTSDDFTLEVSGLTPDNFGIVFYGDASAELPFGGHFVYIAGPITRLPPAGPSSPTGTVSQPIPIDPGLVGTTRFYQYWGRDPGAGDGSGIELSSALQVPFCN